MKSPNQDVNKKAISRTLKMVKDMEISVIRFSEPDQLFSALKNSEIDAAVRGNLPAKQSMDGFCKTYNMDKPQRASFLSNKDNFFALAPVGIAEGNTPDERWSILCNTVEFIQNKLCKKNPEVAILSMGRLNDVGRDRNVTKSLKEGKQLVKMAQDMEFRSKHFGILIENALSSSDIIISQNGPMGNTIFRLLHYKANYKGFGAPILGIEEVFLDSSRGRGDYLDPLVFASYIAIRSRKKRQRINPKP